MVQNFSKAWGTGNVPVPDALDQAFLAVDKGLEQEEIMYPGATCVAAFVHVDDGKVVWARRMGRAPSLPPS